MPCNDSSSSIAIRLDQSERLVSFEFAKITCGREISAETEYQKFCKGKTLDQILEFRFSELIPALNLTGDEEKQYVLYLEWDALRSAIAQYLGRGSEDIDMERCRITSIVYGPQGIEIAEVVLPPKEMPKILPCNLAQNN